LFTLLISEEGFDELKAHVRETNEGIVDVNAMVAELKDILSNDKLKN
jgi:hypothetical protein